SDSLAVVDFEGDTDGPGDPPADLDLVDHRRLRLVHELERRAPRVEEHDARAAVGLPRLQLGQPEGVAVERERLLDVVDGQDESELHTEPSCRTGSLTALAARRAPRPRGARRRR